MRLSKLEKQLLSALKDAGAHLDYCGYGDSWERQGTEKLARKIELAISAAEKTKAHP